MRAMIVRNPGPPEVMGLEDVAVPDIRPNDVMIRVAACGVCFHDVVCRNGVLKHGIEMPIVPGHEIAGTVEAVGSQVMEFRIGDRVAAVSQRYTCGLCRPCRLGLENLCEKKEVIGDRGLNGGYAEYVAVDQRGIAKVPASVDLDAAAIVGCAVGCQLNGVRDVGKVKLGDEVLVTGAGGGVGIHGVQIAKRAGGRVIAVTTSPDKAKIVLQAGADDVIIGERGKDFSGRVLELTGGRGVDVALDNVGTPLFKSTRRSLGAGGRWVLVGQVTGDFVSFNPAQLFLRGISMLSATGARKTQLDDALKMIERGELKPMIHEILPLTEAPRAHKLMELGVPIGRVLLKPNV